MCTLQSLNRILYFIALIIVSLTVLPSRSQAQAWLGEVNKEDEFAAISIPERSRSDMLRATKFLAPIERSPETLHTVYQNVNTYRLHIDFMRTEFPGYFSGLSAAEYLDMVYYRSSRRYFAGVVYQFSTQNGGTLYGFNVYHAPGESLTEEEAALLYARLSETFGLRPLAYSPISPDEIADARAWKAPGFPVYFPEGVTEPEYEVYSARANYGRIRLYSLVELDSALAEGKIGWQDIVVIDQAPTDIETVVAGIITGTRQGALSHVNVRALRRGTPNAYVQNPLTVFKPYENQLVRLTLTENGYLVTPNVTLEEAEEWWDENRPSIPPLSQPDDRTAEFLKINLVHPGIAQDQPVQTYGGKAGQLAIAYGFLDPEYQVEGFAVPFKHYLEFMQSNTIQNPNNPSQYVTYEEYLDILMQDDLFRSDSAYRRYRLETFIEYARDYGNVNPLLVERLLELIPVVFGSTSVRVRFRSSSNAEDSLLFNGAGLYESTTVCPDDNLDGDNKGPSRCDPTEKNERTIERGLKKVWMSLWSPKAFEEREYYQIGHEQVRMGVLVTRAFPDEDANGVAFSGDPIRDEKYYQVVNVQRGDESVVQPGTGIVPETDIVFVYPGGGWVQRVRPSSLVEDGEWVLTEEQLIELGTVVQFIDERMPLSDPTYLRKDVIMDVEFKFDEGQLFIKQVRPTLTQSAQPIGELPDVKLIIPENTRLASVFIDGRPIEGEYENLSMLYLRAGEYDMPTTVSEQEMSLIDRFEYAPERHELTPESNGRMKVHDFATGDGHRQVQFDYTQRFRLPDGRMMEITLSNLRVVYKPGMQDSYEIRLTEEYISSEFVYGGGTPDDGEYYDSLRFASVAYPTLQIYQHTVELAGGGRIELYRRHQIPFAGSGPANLVYAIVNYDGETRHQDDYWKLVYAAVHHNWDEQYRVVFETPIGNAYGIDVDTFTFENRDTPRVFLLDESLNRYEEIGIVNYTEEEVDQLPGTPVGQWLLY